MPGAGNRSEVTPIDPNSVYLVSVPKRNLQGLLFLSRERGLEYVAALTPEGQIDLTLFTDFEELAGHVSIKPRKVFKEPKFALNAEDVSQTKNTARELFLELNQKDLYRVMKSYRMEEEYGMISALFA